MKYRYEKIPSEMRNADRWVLWIKGERNGTTTKIPINAMTGHGAKSNDPGTWTSFDRALSALDQQTDCVGLGFMLGDGWFGIDLDNHGTRTRAEMETLEREFLDALPSYNEYSQSGNGIHIICRGHLPETPERRRRAGDIEMYDSGRFFALTGNVVRAENARTVIDGTEAVKRLYDKYLATAPSGGYTMDTTISDNAVIQSLFKGKGGKTNSILWGGEWEGLYDSHSEADLALCNAIAVRCGSDPVQVDRIFRQSGLYRPKWDEKHGSQTYGQKTVATACSERSGEGVITHYLETGDLHAGEDSKGYELSDTGNAERFIAEFGKDLRYNGDNKTWLVWDGTTWRKDDKQQVKRFADVMLQEMRAESWDSRQEQGRFRELERNCARVASSTGKEAMLKEAQHIGDTPVTNADFNRDDYLLNCASGVIDLRTGEMREHRREDMNSLNTDIAVDMDGKPERWLQFLREIFNGDDTLIDYVQTAVGYSLTGDTREQCLFQCWGDGSNGKSVFFDIVSRISGDYGSNAQVETLLNRGKPAGGVNTDVARLAGKRYVRTNEPDEGSRFNEGLVKQLVSGDLTTARFLYGQEFEFRPKFKIWIATNHKIVIRGTDHGIWRRMRMIPFAVKFEGDRADKGLTQKLEQELPQILGWAVRGAIRWYAEGLRTPEVINEANEEYREEMDTLERFLDACTIRLPASTENASKLYQAFARWAKDGREPSMSQTKFGIEMRRKGFEKITLKGRRYYRGVILQETEQSGAYVYSEEDREQ